MKILRSTILILLFNFIALGVKAQGPDAQIIVNELYNPAGPTQNDEWTELVVVKDDLDLRNWFIGDNNGTTSSWQEKFKFKNIPFWNHLRAGTIIMVDHAENSSKCKTNQLDVDKSDGYVRICCRNTTYFEGGSTGTNSMNINSQGDFIQIVNPTGYMYHALGFDGDPKTSVVGGVCFNFTLKWTDISGSNSAARPCANYLFFKANLDGNLTGVIATAGNLADFSQPIQEFSNPFVDTTSTPFEGIGNGAANNAWIINLRAPIFDAQNVCYNKNANGEITINWLAATDPFPTDNTIGYLVVRNETGDFSSPENGKEYAANATFGTGNQVTTVVETIIGSQNTTFIENPGSGTFFYRVFPFRYKNTIGFFHPTRGRTYNTTQFVKVTEGGAEVTTLNDTLCASGFASLKVKAPPGSTYSWFTVPVGGTPILNENADSLFFNTSQTISYYVQVSNSALCANQRVEVRAVFQPLVSNYLSQDSVCEGTPAVLTGDSVAGISYIWTLVNPPAGVSGSGFNSRSFSISTPFFPEPKSIVYTVKARNKEGCESFVRMDTITTCTPVFNLKPINNLITDNGDNQNNTLDFDRREVKNLEIYNRWGKKVFSATSYLNDWKPGTSENGTFFYVAEVKEPRAADFRKMSGWVLIIK